MHELSIAQSIVEIVQQYVPTGRSVHTVKVAVGQLSGVVPDSLDFCFGAIVKDTELHGASLDIAQIPTRALCRTCGAEFAVQDSAFLCANCRGTDLQILSGMELKVTEIELADEISGVE